MSKVCHMLFQKCLRHGHAAVKPVRIRFFAFSGITYDILYRLIDPLLPLTKANPTILINVKLPSLETNAHEPKAHHPRPRWRHQLRL